MAKVIAKHIWKKSHNDLMPIKVASKWKWIQKEPRRHKKTPEWDMDTMGSRVVPSGVGSLDNSLSHPITLRAPPPLQTLLPPLPCPPDLQGHTTSHTTMTPSLALIGWMERERDREKKSARMVGCSSRGGLCNHCAYFMGAQCYCSRLWVSVTNNVIF